MKEVRLISTYLCLHGDRNSFRFFIQALYETKQDNIAKKMEEKEKELFDGNPPNKLLLNHVQPSGTGVR